MHVCVCVCVTLLPGLWVVVIRWLLAADYIINNFAENTARTHTHTHTHTDSYTHKYPPPLTILHSIMSKWAGRDPPRFCDGSETILILLGMRMLWMQVSHYRTAEWCRAQPHINTNRFNVFTCTFWMIKLGSIRSHPRCHLIPWK